MLFVRVMVYVSGGGPIWESGGWGLPMPCHRKSIGDTRISQVCVILTPMRCNSAKQIRRMQNEKPNFTHWMVYHTKI